MDGISSSVAQYSMASSGAALQQQVSLSVAKKAMDTAESQAQTLINDMLQGVNHANGLGNLVDVLA
nr:YjfB family protein [uncultured Butyricicoccus sp.]